MSDNSDNHRKILEFLAGEFAGKDDRMCIAVDLIYAPGGGFKPDEIRKWSRSDYPDLFDNFANVEKLVMQILEIAEGEADTKPPGKHAFYVRAFKHGGERSRQAFSLSPVYRGGDETSLMMSGAGGGGGRQDVIANHAGQLMRINAQMFEGTIRVLGAQNSDMRAENAELRVENNRLLKENRELRDSKDDREFQYAMIAEKNKRHNAGMQQLLQIAQVVVAKVAGGNALPPGELPPELRLLSEFAQSLRREQIDVFMNALDMGQKAMFMQVMGAVMPQGAQQEAPPQRPASGPTSWVPGGSKS